MFELGRKPSQVILVVFLDQKLQKSQRISVPTDRQTLSMHQYLLIENHRRSVGTPLKVTCTMSKAVHCGVSSSFLMLHTMMGTKVTMSLSQHVSLASAMFALTAQAI